MISNYKATDIKSLDYFEHIRKYPGMYIGSKDAKGLLHCVKEILSNSIDEYLNGAGSTMTAEVFLTGNIRLDVVHYKLVLESPILEVSSIMLLARPGITQAVENMEQVVKQLMPCPKK